MSPLGEAPRLGKDDRLRRDQELVILDCVVELLLENGAALRHEGLLVFPSLFQATEHDAGFNHTIALYYELSGAVDSIYASLVTALAMSRQFGAVRLWEDRAELRRAGEGTTGVRRVQRGGQGARGSPGSSSTSTRPPPSPRASSSWSSWRSTCASTEWISWRA